MARFPNKFSLLELSITRTIFDSRVRVIESLVYIQGNKSSEVKASTEN